MSISSKIIKIISVISSLFLLLNLLFGCGKADPERFIIDFGIKMNISSDDDILISYDGVNYSNSFTSQELYNYSYQNENTSNCFNGTLNQVSSALLVSNGEFPKFYSGVISKDTNLFSSNEVNYSDCVFDIYFKLDSDKKIFWKNSTFLSENEKILPALRMAIVYCGTGSEKTITTSKSGIEENGVNNTICMYEPDSFHHPSSAFNKDIETKYLYCEFSEYCDDFWTIDNSQYAVEPKCTIVKNDDMENAFFYGKTGYNRIRIYIWSEGNDIDSENFDLKTLESLTINLSFTNN